VLVALSPSVSLVIVPVVILASGIGVALLQRRSAARRLRSAAEVDAGALARFALRLPAERWAYGPAFQLRLLPGVRRQYAPGVLGVGGGEVGFVPSDPAKAGLAWSGRPAAVELSPFAQATIVRVRTADPEHRAQFVIQRPVAAVRASLQALVPVEPAAPA
jgi:hypothetical protein